jgi:drug/metabolite transporter (DMT)-like permease
MDFKINYRTGAYLFMTIGVTFIFAGLFLTAQGRGSGGMNGLLAIAGGLCMGKGFTIIRHLSDDEKKGASGKGKGKTGTAGLNRSQRRRKKG